MKKIISLICALALMATMCAFSVSAADGVAIVVDAATEAVVESELVVTVKATGELGLFQMELNYDPATFTYKEGSFATTATAVALKTAEEGKLTIECQNVTGADFADTDVFTATFTALDAAAFEEAVGENDSIDADFTVTIPYDADAAGYVLGNKMGVPYTEEQINITDATVSVILPPSAPVAANVVITGDAMVGSELTATWDYTDINGDEQAATKVVWYADGEAIAEDTVDAAPATYTLTADEYGKVITVGITPANTAEKGDKATEVVSEEATAAVIANPDLKATIVEDSLTIEPADKIRVGREVVVYYELNSPNGGADTSTIIWTDADGNELVGEVSEDGTTFTPDKEDKDKYIKVTVIPDDDRTEANEEAAVELVAEVPVTKKSTGTTAWDDNAGSSLAAPKTEDPVETDKPDETDKPVASGIEKFTDVDAEAYAWAVEGIDELVKAGIIVGVTDTTFEPETKTTRAHFVAMVMRAANAINEEAKASYADVATDFWGYKEIASAEALGALKIFGENFEPEKVITREEMAYVLHEVAAALNIELAETETAEEFSDAASIAEEAAECVTALQKAGILHGMGDGTFMPKGETTRAQAAKVVHLLWTAAK